MSLWGGGEGDKNTEWERVLGPAAQPELEPAADADGMSYQSLLGKELYEKGAESK